MYVATTAMCSVCASFPTIGCYKSGLSTVSGTDEDGLSTGSGVYVNVSPVGYITPSQRTRLTATSVGCRTNLQPPRMAEMSGTTHSKLSAHLHKIKLPMRCVLQLNNIF